MRLRQATEMHRPFNRADAERFVHEADECFRCAKAPGLRPEIADALVVAGHHLMATAVEIEAAIQHAKSKHNSAWPIERLRRPVAAVCAAAPFGWRMSLRETNCAALTRINASKTRLCIIPS